jgi:hypothetical protein
MSPKSNADGAGSADRVAAGLVAFAGKARGQKNGLANPLFAWPIPTLLVHFGTLSRSDWSSGYTIAI